MKLIVRRREELMDLDVAATAAGESTSEATVSLHYVLDGRADPPQDDSADTTERRSRRRQY